MHSPEVLAFSIWRPWPTIHKQPMRRDAPRWQSIIHKRDNGSHFISRFAYAFGYELYFPSIIDVWHMEPGGADSLTICKHRVTDEHGEFVRWSSAWKWHVWHWKISPVFIYGWRRRLLTRCKVCGGRSTNGHRVDLSDSWYPKRAPIWRGETHLRHHDCEPVRK